MAQRQGQNRQQAMLFPLLLDELVPADSLVRVIDAWVGSLDLVALGFKKAVPQIMGAPSYGAGDLLRLYVWGNANAVRSSRRLEDACHRDVECMWLLGRLAPDHKTISEFRRTNLPSLVAACAGFVQFARQQGVLRPKAVAIDGTKLRARSSRSRLAGENKLRELLQQNMAEVQAYMELLEANDQDEDGRAARCSPEAAQRALRKLQDEGAQLQQCLQQILQERRSAAVVGEPEARPMKGLHGTPGYNVQAAVDTQTHLVVHSDVCTDGNDRNQLAPMAMGAAAALGEAVAVVADTGYSNGHQLHELHAQGIDAAVPAHPKTNTRGLLGHEAFTYEPGSDRYVCPQGKLLPYLKTNQNGMLVYAAKPTQCGRCPMKAQCTTSKQRHVTRHPQQADLDRAQRRWVEDGALRRQRSSTVEHVWGTLKTGTLLGGKLLLRGLQGARAEVALAVLAYNIKRMLNIKDANWMMRALQA